MEGRIILASVLVLSVTMVSVHGRSYSQTVPYTSMKEQITNLHFFFHDTLTGKDPSAVLVAKANLTQKGQTPAPFGSLFAINDPLTVGPELSSEVIGNARGVYVSAGKDILTLVMYIDFGFTSGELNGSSISVFSRNPVLEKKRELAVVGGRGKFKMCRGFAQLNTYFVNETNGDAIVEYNVTVLHL